MSQQQGCFPCPRRGLLGDKRVTNPAPASGGSPGEGGRQLSIALGLQHVSELSWGPGWWRGMSVSLCRHLGTSVPQETGLGVLHVGFGVCKQCW